MKVVIDTSNSNAIKVNYLGLIYLFPKGSLVLNQKGDKGKLKNLYNQDVDFMDWHQYDEWEVDGSDPFENFDSLVTALTSSVFNTPLGGSKGTTGWADYLSTQFTDVSPWQPTPNEWVDFPHNSGATIKTQLPLDVSDLFANSKILGRNGDGMFVTVEFLARPTTASQTFLRTAIFIGNNLGPLEDGRIYSRPMSFPKGINEIEAQTFTTGIFTLDTFEANGGSIQFNTTNPIDIWKVRVVPHRTHKAR